MVKKNMEVKGRQTRCGSGTTLGWLRPVNSRSYYSSTVLNISEPHCFTSKMEIITSSRGGRCGMPTRSHRFKYLGRHLANDNYFSSFHRSPQEMELFSWSFKPS